MPRKPVNKKHVPAELTPSAKKKAANANARKNRTTSKDVPGNGLAKGAAKAIEARKRRLKKI